MQLSPEALAKRQRLKDDLEYYASLCLSIRTKSGAVLPFGFNSSQRKLHQAIEQQREETGRVRMLVPKARQLGVSTYIGARFFHKVTHREGTRAYILAHSDQATAALFEMAKRFHDKLPEIMQPATTAHNANELTYGGLDSGYKVGTAKAAGVGRAQTIQLFHGSEVAFWQRAAEHAAGALQAVPEEPGTEIVLESTANGVGGYYYNACMAAQKGEGDFRLCFLPWYEHDEYQRPDDGNAYLSTEWLKYGAVYGLERERLLWAYFKNLDLIKAEQGDPDKPSWLFMQEYPGTLEEAFQLSGDDSFIPSIYVLQARQAKLEVDIYAPLILGLDVAGGGPDHNWLISRKGRVAGRHCNERIRSSDTMEITGVVVRRIIQLKPDALFIDIGGGYGSGVHDRLCELGYGAIVHPVQFGGKATDPANYANKRAEIWGDMKAWFKDPGGADLVDDELLMTHIVAPGFRRNSNNQIVLEDKDKIRERLNLSPDGGDALAMTFAEPVLSRRTLEDDMAGYGHEQADWEPDMVGAG